MKIARFLSLVAIVSISVPAFAQEQGQDTGDLAKKLNNPIANLITVPIEYNKDTGKNYGLTSMLKQVDVAVYLTIKDLSQGKFKAGVRTFGLTDTVEIGGTVYRGVYYAMDKYNKDLVTQDMIRKVTDAEKKIIAGDIIFPSPSH